MVIELVGALSLPIWLCVEEVMRQRAPRPARAEQPSHASVKRIDTVSVPSA